AAPPTAEAPAAAPAAELPSNEGPAAAPVAERPAAAPVEQQAARPKAEKPSEAKGSAEKRRDPESGRVLTYAQLVAMNQGRYSEAEIEQWWAQNCVPVEENDHASDNHRAVLPRLARQGVRGGGFRKAAAGTRSRAVGRRFALLATMLDDMARCLCLPFALCSVARVLGEGRHAPSAVSAAVSVARATCSVPPSLLEFGSSSASPAFDPPTCPRVRSGQKF
ncbi:unnamed protein product, partial [Prorocentrum cordatum]